MYDINSNKSIRSLMLNEIDEIRDNENGFNPEAMRWRNWWFKKDVGLINLSSKKERSNNQPAIRLHESNIMNFATLDDDKLLTTYTLLIRILSKQM